MKVEQAKADVLARFHDPGPARVNCAQAVLRFSLLVDGMDADLAEAARYLGGGVARMGEACGALTGAALVLGLRECRGSSEQGPDLIARNMGRVQRLLRDFTAEFGSSRCRELTGQDISTPEKYKLFRDSEAHTRCAGYVGWVCDRLGTQDDDSRPREAEPESGPA